MRYLTHISTGKLGCWNDSAKTTKPGRIRALLCTKPVELNTGVRDDVVRVELFLHDALLQLRLYAYAQQ